MINITYKVQDEEVETVKWMRDIWKEKWLVKPDSISIQIDELTNTEKKYLEKVMRWVYPSEIGVIIMNGTEYKVEDFLGER